MTPAVRLAPVDPRAVVRHHPVPETTTLQLFASRFYSRSGPGADFVDIGASGFGF